MQPQQSWASDSFPLGFLRCCPSRAICHPHIFHLGAIRLLLKLWNSFLLCRRKEERRKGPGLLPTRLHLWMQKGMSFLLPPSSAREFHQHVIDHDSVLQPWSSLAAKMAIKPRALGLCLKLLYPYSRNSQRERVWK